MRRFVAALALAVPLSLTACPDDPEPIVDIEIAIPDADVSDSSDVNDAVDGEGLIDDTEIDAVEEVEEVEEVEDTETIDDIEIVEDIDTVNDVELPPVDCSGIPEALACTTANETRCAASAGNLVEACTEVEGCLQWTADTFCEDLNQCTGQADKCEAGACVADGDPNAGCAPSDDPCGVNICDPTTGVCAPAGAPDFTTCNDDNVCTADDYCFGGTCVGDSVCPAPCTVDSEFSYFSNAANGPNTNVRVIELKGAGTTNAMSGYSCEGAESGYGGPEHTFQIKRFNFDGAIDCAGKFYVELMNPDDIGTEFVDVIVLGSKDNCFQDSCLAASKMDESGRATADIFIPANPGGPINETVYRVVVDGRDGYTGEVRLAFQCNETDDLVEGFCGDGILSYNDEGVYEACTPGSQCDCSHLSCKGDEVGKWAAPICGYEELFCQDGEDNDGNDATDCADSQCSEDEACATASCEETPVLACGESIEIEFIEGETDIAPDFWFADTCTGGLPAVWSSGTYSNANRVVGLDGGGAACMRAEVSETALTLDGMLIPSCGATTGCTSGSDGSFFTAILGYLQTTGTELKYIGMAPYTGYGKATVTLNCSCP